MRIGIFQGPEAAGSVAGMLDVLDAAARRAASQGIRLLILPELFLTGYNIGSTALRALAEPADGPSATAAAAIAANHGVALLYGYPERGSDGHIYNSAILIGRDGNHAANFRKLHLFGAMENDVFTPGDDPAVMAEIDGMKLGILICYDVEFPEAVRTLALRGARLVAVPTALMHPYAFVPRVLVRARAWENSVFLAYANRTGREGDLHYTGESCILGPEGSELARAGAGEEMIAAELDPALMEKARALNTYLADRRPALYGAVVRASA
jgi:predicted amidohydrolase